MKIKILPFKLLVACILAILTHGAVSAQCDLIVTQIGDPYANPGCNESITLLNNCCDPIDLGGVTVSDNFGVRHTYPAGTILAPGTSITVLAGDFTNDVGGSSCSTTSATGYFNNSSDCAILGNVPATHTAINLGYNNSSDPDCLPAASPFNVTISAGDNADQPTSNYTLVVPPSAPTVPAVTACAGDPTIIIPSVGAPSTCVLASVDFDGGGGFVPSVDFNDGTNDHFSATTGNDISLVGGGSYSFDDGVNMFWARGLLHNVGKA